MAGIGKVKQLEDELAARWPGRVDQIAQVLRLIGRPSQPGTSFFVYGNSGTGKTRVIRDCIQSMRRQYAYFEVNTTSKPKHLFSSVLSQLHRVKRKHDKGYGAVVCDSPSEFMVEVAKACPANQASATFIILDNVHLLAKGTLLQALLHTASYAGANVQFILVSRRSWATCEFCEGTGSDGLPQVFFPDYNEEQLLSILKAPPPDAIRNPLESQIWGQYTAGVIYTHFKSASHYITDLRGLSRTLWDHYILPLRTRQVDLTLPVDRVVRALLAQFRRQVLHSAMANFEPGLMQSADDLLRSSQQGAATAAEGVRGSCAWGSLPRSARLILVAAYLASHNKPSSDRAVFDATSGGRKRGRKRGGAGGKTMDSDRQYEASKEAMLKGPSPFNLNRLLNIHNHLYIAAEHSNSVSRRCSSLGGAGIAGGSLCDVCVPSLMVTSEVLDSMERADKQKLQRLEDGKGGPRRGSSIGGGGLQGPASEGQGLSQGAGMSSQGAGGEGRGFPLGGQGVQGVGANTDQWLNLGGHGAQGGGANTGRLSMGGHSVQGVGTSTGRLSKGGGGDPRRMSWGGGGDPGRLSMGGPGGSLGGARLSGSSSMWGLIGPDAGVSGGTAGLGGLDRGGGHTVRAPGSHLPHPASGAVRHGKAHVSLEAAGVFSTIASLASMGLLLREKSDDPLEAPRFTVAINKSLAADLARSMGLDINSYLKLD